MKDSCAAVGIGKLCGLFGKTRHAFYDREWHQKEKINNELQVLEMIHMIRREMPRIGTRKLYYMLQEFYQEHNIKMGRDALHALLRDNKLLVQPRKRYAQTTNSRHWMRKWPNLIQEVKVSEPEQVWVSDITYIRLQDEFNYLSLITDAYSRKIVGYYLHKSLSNHGTLEALRKALASRSRINNGLIHHSDRGIQYCSNQYVNLLKSSNIKVSMTENGSPYENALAERVNGILKTEFGLGDIFKTRKQALESTEKSIGIYNDKRPHLSCRMLTPSQAHDKRKKLVENW